MRHFGWSLGRGDFARTAARLVLLALSLLALSPAAPALAAPASQVAGGVTGVYIHMPPNVPADRPLQVLLAFHGMGDSGESFAAGLQAQADKYGWVIVAPTIAYGDWRNVTQLTREDPALIRWLIPYLDNLPNQLGRPVQDRVLLFGHSRGAQLTHRLALTYPERVLAVASISAGAYTLPEATFNGRALAYPFGVANLATYTSRSLDLDALSKVRFLIGVGSLDTNPADVTHEWDPYIGATRRQRAEAFDAALRDQGVPSTLNVFPFEGHDLTPAMVTSATTWLATTGQGRRRPPRANTEAGSLALLALAS
jgi:predicted esterase